MIKTKNLTYEYSINEDSNKITKKALNDLNIEIKEGEFVAILGHNGSGKSTFAKHINALKLPTDGNIYIDGKDTKDANLLTEIRQIATMVFQNPDNQIIGSIVEEDVGFGLENLNIPTAEIWKRVDESLKIVDMYKYKNSSPNKLSGGQKQRIAIAGVLAMKPKCIVLDEPTAMLDPQGRREVIDTIYKLNKECKVTIVLITHHMEEVVNASRIILMDNGKVILDGSPRDIFLKVDLLEKIGLTVPDIVKLSLNLINAGIDINVAFSVDELVENLNQYKKGVKNEH